MNIYEQLIVSLKQIHEETVEVLRPNENEGISHGQMFLLFAIYNHGQIKTTDISNHFGITPGAATSIADKLESLGLIERQRNTQDRRVVMITLSEKGREYVVHTKKRNVEKLEQILSSVPEEKLKATIQAIDEISTIFKAVNANK
ncbi:MarR family transcriptional regulator [Alkalihalobacillus sp. LMS39]|uniref:MarR family winged helix-turn-helix transcriptional regulator n=1 Tax=Alkalihalobacillus sp. LMS39 TaxID=2924032 RepID=UPI001FB341AA|nr:MarR family transcriptional regulator [Alkalihalobacillus sp. LMS39]UOE94317.1 MarR family transcriptional regulator [Alkalihalobacillus sp. LMS39]